MKQKAILILTLPVPGHIHPGFRIAEQLASKGHSIRFATLMDTLSLITPQTEIKPLVFGAESFPLGSLFSKYSDSTRKSGIRAFVDSLTFMQKLNYEITHDLYAQIQFLGQKIDLVLCDELISSGKLLAQKLETHHASFAAALSILPDRSGIAPSPHSPNEPSTDFTQRLKTQTAARFLDYWARSTLKNVASPFRGLAKSIHKIEDTFSSSLHLSLCPEAFDFPRKNLAKSYRYALPPHLYRNKAVETTTQSPRPILYASLGTLIHLSERKRILSEISHIGTELGYDTHIGLGAWSPHADDGEEFHEDSTVYDMAPQLDLIERAALVITHGGMNTVMESLAAGKPLLSIPFNQDQFGVSSRMKHHGLGRILSFGDASGNPLRDALSSALEDEEMKNRASQFQNHFKTQNTPKPGDLIHDQFLG